MVDKSALGAVGEPFSIDVERGKIHEFARAVRARHPAHYTGDHPTIPPTFLTTMFFWEELVPGSNPWHLVKMDRRRGMHAEQEYSFHGPPPRAGARLDARSRIAEIYDKEGRRGGALTFAVMITELRYRPGALVAEAKLTGVETAKAASAEGDAVRAVADAPADITHDPRLYADAAFTPMRASEVVLPRWGELAEGTSAPSPLTLGPLTRTDFVRYQGASGDMNPIHHDEPFARAAGYPAPLGVGMLPAGALAAWAAGWLGPENLRRVRVRWKEQVWPGDVITCSGAVTRRYEEQGEHKVDLDLVCTRRDGCVAVQAAATFVVPT